MERKEKVKRLKRDKSEVLDLLFNLFTKEQFYNIKDLEKKTKQPTVIFQSNNIFVFTKLINLILFIKVLLKRYIT